MLLRVERTSAFQGSSTHIVRLSTLRSEGGFSVSLYSETALKIKQQFNRCQGAGLARQAGIGGSGDGG
jgi:hypothetical protein